MVSYLQNSTDDEDDSLAINMDYLYKSKNQLKSKFQSQQNKNNGDDSFSYLFNTYKNYKALNVLENEKSLVTLESPKNGIVESETSHTVQGFISWLGNKKHSELPMQVEDSCIYNSNYGITENPLRAKREMARQITRDIIELDKQIKVNHSQTKLMMSSIEKAGSVPPGHQRGSTSQSISIFDKMPKPPILDKTVNRSRVFVSLSGNSFNTSNANQSEGDGKQTINTIMNSPRDKPHASDAYITNKMNVSLTMKSNPSSKPFSEYVLQASEPITVRPQKPEEQRVNKPEGRRFKLLIKNSNALPELKTNKEESINLNNSSVYKKVVKRFATGEEKQNIRVPSALSNRPMTVSNKIRENNIMARQMNSEKKKVKKGLSMNNQTFYNSSFRTKRFELNPLCGENKKMHERELKEGLILKEFKDIKESNYPKEPKEPKGHKESSEVSDDIEFFVKNKKISPPRVSVKRRRPNEANIEYSPKGDKHRFHAKSKRGLRLKGERKKEMIDLTLKEDLHFEDEMLFNLNSNIIELSNRKLKKFADWKDLSAWS